MSLSPALARAGRALLSWSVDALADAAGVRADVVATFEAGGGVSRGEAAALERAFAEAGLALIGEGESSLQGGAGIRFRTARMRDEGLRPADLTTGNDD